MSIMGTRPAPCQESIQSAMLGSLHRNVVGLAQLSPIRSAITNSKVTKPLVDKFVAGDSAADAVRLTLALQEKRIHVALDLLGEDVETEAEATRAADEYQEVIDLAHAQGVDSPYISVKLTALGLSLGEGVATRNLRRILSHAGGAFVRVDMESSRHTESTVNVVLDLHQEFPELGTVLQSCLFRTDRDIETMIDAGVPIRLVKGAYVEPAEVAYQSKAEVVRAYRRQMARMINSELPLAIATHDENLIATAKKHIRESKRNNDTVEFQLLLGLREDLRDALVEEGYHMRVYIPFGSQWYPYLVRRLAERPANLALVARNILPRRGR